MVRTTPPIGVFAVVLAAVAWTGSQPAGFAADEVRRAPRSFDPIVRPTPPQVRDPSRVRNPIDQFVEARLEESGLSLAPPADPETLARRMHRVMLGLPPTPERIRTFVASEDPAAYESLVDEMLDSPRYGERWGRHWLDVVRFAESHGFETNTPREEAWPYRDWVIAAFNDDLPFDRFVLEQLAGDAFSVDAATGFLVAGPYDTVKSPDVVLTRTQRRDELADIVGATSGAFLGLTVGCARCHDHKFDPITQRDFYAMESVFSGVQHGTRPNRPLGGALGSERLEVLEEQLAQARGVLGAALQAALPSLRGPVDPRRNEERFPPQLACRVRFVATATNDGAEPCIDELEVYAAPADVEEPSVQGPGPREEESVTPTSNVTPISNVALSAIAIRSSGDYVGNPIHQLAHLNDGETGNTHSWISSTRGAGWVEIELAGETSIDRVVWGRDREGVYRDRLPIAYEISVGDASGEWRRVAGSDDRLPAALRDHEDLPSSVGTLSDRDRAPIDAALAEVAALEAKVAAWRALPSVYAGRFEQPAPTRLLYRGDPMAEREEVAPDIPAIFGSLDLPVDAPEQERRLAFAKWIASPDNPLTARVIVNRIWMHHFGEGLVETPSDFGNMGGAPSHPALLDWLACELIESGYRIKHLQRLILMSGCWRQSSRPIAMGLQKDQGSRLLWRFPPRRMEAEAIRDSMLFVAGTLDLTMGGPGFSVFLPDTNYVRVYTPKPSFGPDDWRRTIYMTKVRMEQDAVFGAFDAPDAGLVCAKRSRSTTPLQALNLWNSPRALQQAERFAARVDAEVGEVAAAPDERGRKRIGRAFQLALGRDPDPHERTAATRLVNDQGLIALCRVLFNANEFAFIE